MNVYTYPYSNRYNPPAPIVEISVSQVGVPISEVKIQTLVDSAADATMIPIDVIKKVKARW